MPTRREFLLRALPAPALALTATLRPGAVEEAVAALARDSRPAEEAADDESFWATVQHAFAVDRSLINLNNGGVSPAPQLVQDALKRHLDYSNQAPVYTMWRVLEPQLESVRRMLARTFGCDAEEVAVTRNASEGLQICQFGFDLRRGDEVLTTNQDYPRMITTWQQRERREGIRLVQISIPTPAEDDDEVVARFQRAITPRTRLIHLCHMINLTGQILPVRRVVQMARTRGIPVIVDGAHAFGQFPFSHADLDCDYYSTSLHKWLFAPIGTGMLYVRRERIADLWPLQAAPEGMRADIRKFEEIGTHPAANHLAVAEAVRFTEAIGLQRKAARLVYLRDRWAVPLSRLDNVRLHTSLRPGLAYGLANVQIRRVDPGALAAHLWERHRILVTPIKHPEFEGIRVTPNVYTTPAEVDQFTEAMHSVARRGLPSAMSRRTLGAALLLATLTACAPAVAPQPVSTPAAPAAVGHYSQAIRAGRTLYLSGQVALDPRTGALMPGDITVQTRQTLENVRAILQAEGLTLGHVVQVQVFLADLNDYATFNRVYAEIFGDHRPARAVVQVARVPLDARVEIMATAVR